MFDGSSLQLEENLRTAAELLEECAPPKREILEVECGVVGGEEDGVNTGDTPLGEVSRRRKNLLRVAEVLGTGERAATCSQATFGNVHGVYAPR